jgi:hypothetical protein
MPSAGTSGCEAKAGGTRAADIQKIPKINAFFIPRSPLPFPCGPVSAEPLSPRSGASQPQTAFSGRYSAGQSLLFNAGINNSNCKSKPHPCSFDLAAAAKALLCLADLNALHFDVTSCHAFHFRIKNGSIFDPEIE